MIIKTIKCKENEKKKMKKRYKIQDDDYEEVNALPPH